MENLFKNKNIAPMLLHRSEPFNSEDYIFELKFDGARCIAYLENDKTSLRNKRNRNIDKIYPELSNLHKNVKKPCILDGELVVMKDGIPDFTSLQKRALLNNEMKINIASKMHPACLIVYDILQIEDKVLLETELMERKQILESNIISNQNLILSKYIETYGKNLFDFAEKNNLEGIVAKKKDSKYYLNKRTKLWLKIKVMKEESFVICGYIDIKNGDIDLILGEYREGRLEYIGIIHGLDLEEKKTILSFARCNKSKLHFAINEKNIQSVHWIKPQLKARVKYMLRTETNRLRQAIFVGLDDKGAVK